MVIFRILWAFITSRILWTLIGLALLSLLIWIFGPIVRVGSATPFESETVRLGMIAGLVILWLIWLIMAQRRAMRANRLFVAEIAPPVEEKKLGPGEQNVAAVGAKFQDVMSELKRSKLGGRKFLRDMPWYVIIGPPATGKTTALRQSGLTFPIDLTDDLQGVGGTRNCDWFFTEDAVLIDTAGRYVQQESQPDVDAAEWVGFLDLLKKHRGRRALNGVILALSVDALLDDEAAIKAHGRKLRKRLVELQQRLQIRLPVYLMLTKADLIKGFEPFFQALSTADREQVWGATFPVGARVGPADVTREMTTLATELDRRLVPRLESEESLAERAEIFRFPAQLETLSQPIAVLVDAVFGESRYDDSAWLRGIYLTSATQEGTPIDRLTASLSASFGLPQRRVAPAQRVERRSFFLKNLLTDVIFREAGLGTFDPAVQRRRLWIWRGAAAASAIALIGAVVFSTIAYRSGRNAIAAQAAQLEALQAPLTPFSSRSATVDPPDIDTALAVMDEVVLSRTEPPGGPSDFIGPTATPEILQAQADAYEHGLRNILQPRMVALLENTMWRQIRDPEFLFGALKTYFMMTGQAQLDTDFAKEWWTGTLPDFATTAPFGTEQAAAHEMAAIDGLAVEQDFIKPDGALVEEALKTICSVPLPVRAYRTLLADPAVAELKDWVPASFTGPNGSKVLARRSGKTLRVGISGAFTYQGFHDVILDRLDDVAGRAALDRSVFEGGCPESAEPSVAALSQDILKLYYEDYMAQWDGFLHDMRLVQLNDLPTATENLKDLSSADSSLKRLLTAVVRETELDRVEDDADGGGGGDNKLAKKGTSTVLSKLGKVGKLVKTGVKFLPKAGQEEVNTTGTIVAEHFKGIKSTVAEVDGQPPALDAAVAAMLQLSNVLQTVMSTPNPDDAIKSQGGLPALTGAVATQAALLPEPVGDWLTGIASDAAGISQIAVQKELNAIWRVQVLGFCEAAINDRYPFSAESTVDVTVADFARLFGPGGEIDGFINNHLLPYVDTTSEPWKWRADFGLDSKALAAFQQARRIRDDLFPGGTGPVMNFTLEPKDLAPSATRVTLNVDGQSLVFFNNATRPQPMSWPGKDGTGNITLTFQPVDGAEVMVSESGTWAWLRLLRANKFAPTNLPEVYLLRLSAQGFYADYLLKAASVENPYNLQMFAKFTCPTKI